MTETETRTAPSAREEPPVVLVAEDDEDLADTYAAWFDDRYDVRTAYGGEEALGKLDEDVDVVLLDRRMPDVPGDEVLEELRSRDIDCQVSMLTAVEPDSDIVDMPFEEYVVKPVTQSELVDVVEELLLRGRFDEATQEYLALSSTEEALDERDGDTLRDPDAVADLREEVRTAGEDERVREQAAQLERLKRVNSLIRDVNRMVVQAGTRAEIEERVCDLLVERGPYRYALVGEYTATYETLDERAAASDEDARRDGGEVDASVADDGPVARALEEDRVEVVDVDERGDGTVHEAVADVAFDARPRTAAVVPLRYRDTVYGALLIYGASDVARHERETLSELGDVVAYAINGAESKRLMFADTVVELEFDITDRGDVFVDLSASLDCRVTLEGFVPSAESEVTCYLTVEGTTGDDVLEFFAESAAVGDYRGIDDGGDALLFEATVGGDSVLLTFLGTSASVETLFVDQGDGTVSVEVAPEADPRTVVETVEREFPETAFVRKRSRERPFHSTSKFRSSLDERLTDRQRTVVRAAYEGGYFEWPRASDAEDVADALEISSPTLHEHLRQAIRKLVETYLDEAE
ncbi:MAG: bacterio-opsin activator domain-containing protein [Halobacteriaceae archaeon]